jgi:DNA mismatch repair ATPase MutS
MNKNNADQAFIVALCENKAREVGFAALNVHLSHVIFSQFTDSFNGATTLAQLQLCPPRELLLPHSAAHSHLAALLRERFPAANFVEVFFVLLTFLPSLFLLSFPSFFFPSLLSFFLSFLLSSSLPLLPR